MQKRRAGDALQADRSITGPCGFVAQRDDSRIGVEHVSCNALELLRRLINFGAKQELFIKPAGLRFTMPKVDNQKTECLTPEQGRALIDALDAAKDQNLASLVRLALATGMRRGALLALQWDDLDFRTGHITLRGESAKSGKTSQIPMTIAARGAKQGKFQGWKIILMFKNISKSH